MTSFSLDIIVAGLKDWIETSSLSSEAYLFIFKKTTPGSWLEAVDPVALREWTEEVLSRKIESPFSVFPPCSVDVLKQSDFVEDVVPIYVVKTPIPLTEPVTITYTVSDAGVARGSSRNSSESSNVVTITVRSISERLVCFYSGRFNDNVLFALFGFSSVTAGRFPQNTGEVVVSHWLSERYGFSVGDNITVDLSFHASLLKHLGVNASALGVNESGVVRVFASFKIVGIIDSYGGIIDGAYIFSFCDYVFPALDKSLKPILGPRGYSFSGGELWPAYLIVKLSPRAFSTGTSLLEALDDVKRSLGLCGVSEDEYYVLRGSPLVSSVRERLKSVSSSFQVATILSWSSVVFAPLVLWALLLRHKTRSLILFEVLGAKPGSIMLSLFIVFCLASIIGVFIGFILSRVFALILVESVLDEEMARIVVASANPSLEPLAVVVAVSVALAFYITWRHVNSMDPSLITRSEE
jgi:hypothetical protein